MWVLDYKESWVPKNWCFWTVVLEKPLESPLDCNEIQPVHSEGDQPWDFFGRTDAEAETPVLWPPHVKSWLIGKDPDARRDWGQEEKGTAEDEMAGWNHWLNGRESEWTPGVGDGQGDLACCNSWGRKESDTTEWLNWTEHAKKLIVITVVIIIIERELIFKAYEQLQVWTSFPLVLSEPYDLASLFQGPVSDPSCLWLHLTMVQPDRMVSVWEHSQSICICTKFYP